jgi:hypothetical protein
MFSEKEATCSDNCIKKTFSSDRLLKSYIPFRLKQGGELTEKNLEKRLNNPTDAYGPYFYASTQ